MSTYTVRILDRTVDTDTYSGSHASLNDAMTTAGTSADTWIAANSGHTKHTLAEKVGAIKSVTENYTRDDFTLTSTSESVSCIWYAIELT